MLAVSIKREQRWEAGAEIAQEEVVPRGGLWGCWAQHKLKAAPSWGDSDGSAYFSVLFNRNERAPAAAVAAEVTAVFLSC